MPEKVQLDLTDQCKGVTDEAGHKFVADKRGDVTVPSYLAAQLKASGAARPARRQFGGFSLPTKDPA
jgi:hypothetical protein